MKTILTCSFFLFLTLPIKANKIIASSLGYTATDATVAFQNAINTVVDTVIIDFVGNGEWIVKPSTFFNLANKKIIFEPSVQLIAMPGEYLESRSDCLLRLKYCDNVALIGHNTLFKMQKAEYTSGESRHCISLFDSDNITISNFRLTDSGGDGIYIVGERATKYYCENITIQNVLCDNNRRQGLSVISVQNLLVENCEFKNTKGTLPQAGVDLEPNEDLKGRLVNIVFRKCSFTQNDGSGIEIAPNNLTNMSPAISVQFDDCYLSQNHLGSFGYDEGEIRANSPGTNFPSGQVTFNRCLIENSQWCAVTARKAADSYGITFNDCVFKNVAQSTADFNNPIWLETVDYGSDANPITSPKFGGFTFNNLLIEFNTNKAFLRAYSATNSPIVDKLNGNITVINPIANTSPIYSNMNSTPSLAYTYNFITNYPTTTANIASATSSFHEAICNKNIFSINRASSNSNYPLAVNYYLTGAANNAIDYWHMPPFNIVPSSINSIKDSLIAYDDAIVEPDETIVTTISSSTDYTIGSSSFTTLLQNGTCTSILPVKFISINATPQNNNHLIQFTVTNEVINSKYIIEKSLDGISFSSIGEIIALNQGQYQFINYSVPKRVIFYRIKQIENETIYYSKIVTMSWDKNEINFYPNPTTDFLYIVNASSQIRIKIIDTKGTIIKTITNITSQKINIADLPKGVYIVSVTEKNKAITNRLFTKL
jgi:hypothetical protein